ncbi:hypothetical protein [Halonatronum saccharophilum]|uniref:hypothetical protein n=1 Tax=Halonatronum saccharophilum TaxID=150060 RepID=UPI00048579AF|nr:hypothetical protein [Halonatronum saccharophilum]
MSKLCLSVRITDKYFSIEEIAKIEEELEGCENKSAFLRNAIREYLKLEKNYSNEVKGIGLSDSNFKDLKRLIEENNMLLKSLKDEGMNFSYKESQTVYEGDEQEVKTEQVLNLLDQF